MHNGRLIAEVSSEKVGILTQTNASHMRCGRCTTKVRDHMAARNHRITKGLVEDRAQAEFWIGPPNICHPAQPRIPRSRLAAGMSKARIAGPRSWRPGHRLADVVNQIALSIVISLGFDVLAVRCWVPKYSIVRAVESDSCKDRDNVRMPTHGSEQIGGRLSGAFGGYCPAGRQARPASTAHRMQFTSSTTLYAIS